MIYLPHPTFNFENANGGGIAGIVLEKEDTIDNIVGSSFSHERSWTAQWVSEIPIWDINVSKVISKFERARSGYWEGRHHKAPDTTYAFLREDGAEFGVRFIRADKVRWDIVGYWRCSHRTMPLHRNFESPILQFKLWLESECGKKLGAFW